MGYRWGGCAVRDIYGAVGMLLLEYLRRRRIIKYRAELAACETEAAEINRLIQLRQSIYNHESIRLANLARWSGGLSKKIEMEEGH